MTLRANMEVKDAHNNIKQIVCKAWMSNINFCLNELFDVLRSHFIDRICSNKDYKLIN